MKPDIYAPDSAASLRLGGGRQTSEYNTTNQDISIHVQTVGNAEETGRAVKNELNSVVKQIKVHTSLKDG